MWKQQKSIILLATLTLAACNGGGGGGGGSKSGGATPSYHLPTSVGNISGAFLDSAVIGLNYTTGSSSGVTGAGGSYNCAAGDMITFKLGSLVIGSAPCLPVITPIEIVSNGAVKASEATFSGNSVSELSSSQNIKLRKLSMFLQTLDSDGTVNNGITPHASAETVVSGLLGGDSLLDVLSSSEMDDFEDALDAYVSTQGGSHVAATAISSMIHIQSTIVGLSACTTSDVPNSATVMGFAPNCIALTCVSGSTLSDGECSSPQVYSFANVISYLDNKYQRPFSSGREVFNSAERFWIGPQGQRVECRNENVSPYQDFFSFTSYIDADAVLEDVLALVKTRAYGPYTTQANETFVIAGKKCAKVVAQRILNGVMTDQYLLSGLLNEIGATESQAFVGGGLTPYDLQILDLLIQHYSL